MTRDGGSDPQPAATARTEKPWWRSAEFVVGCALFLLGGPLNYFSTSPRILYVGALGLCVLVFFGTHRLVVYLEGRNAVIATPVNQLKAPTIAPPPGSAPLMRTETDRPITLTPVFARIFDE